MSRPTNKSQFTKDIESAYGAIRFLIQGAIFLVVLGMLVGLLCAFGAGMRYSQPIADYLNETFENVQEIEFTVNGEVVE